MDEVSEQESALLKGLLEIEDVVDPKYDNEKAIVHIYSHKWISVWKMHTISILMYMKCSG